MNLFNKPSPMPSKSTRFHQRFANFKKAFLQLKAAMDRFEELDDLSREGLIQRFEYTFELAWKTLKDYNESQGFITGTPRETLKQAFQANILDNGEIWMEMLDKRDFMLNTYKNNILRQSLKDIRLKYFEQIEKLHDYFSSITDKQLTQSKR